MRASAYKFSQKLLGEAGVRIAATIFVLLLARRLGADDFGVYSTAMAYAALCIVFVDMGTNAILTREMARRHEDRLRIAQSSHWLKLVAAAGAWFILWLVTHALSFTSEARFLTLALGLVVIGQTLTDYFSSLLTGIEEMGWEALLKVSARSLCIVFGLVPLALGKPLSVIVSSMAVGSFLGYIASVLILRHRLGSFGAQADYPLIKELLHSSLPLFVSVAFWILYESQDILLLNFFGFPPSEIGQFSAAIKIIDVLRVYPVLLVGVFFPALSRLHITDPVLFGQKKQKLYFFLGLSLLGISTALSMGSSWIVRAFYDTGFDPAIVLLQTLAWALCLSGLNYAQTQFLISQNRERKLLAGALLACLANLFLALWWVPQHGTLGTCYAMIGSEVCYFLFLLKASRG